MMLSKLLRKKSQVPSSNTEVLERSLTSFDLTLMGIGAIIGAGVFVLTGIAAAREAGPAIVISYAIAGFAAMLAALCYAELASSIGGTGSAYSYAYAGFGEFIAWMLGWNLLLEYAVAVSAVSVGWSGYIANFLESIHLPLPKMLTTSPFENGLINLPAVCIVLFAAILLTIGVKQSARFNAVIVFVKLATVLLFIIVAITNVNPANWSPFLPFGFNGVIGGATLVFFSYIGFDALSTAVEEAVEPERSIPIGIISSVIICTLVYILVSALLTGIAPYPTLDDDSPVAQALLTLGYTKIGGFIAAGAIAGLTTVILIMYYGLTRIILAMSRDGLLPARFATINKRLHTPIKIIWFCAFIVGLLAGVAPIHQLAELVNIGTLAAFVFVCMGVIVFRRTHPHIHRPFKVKFYPWIPLGGTLICFYLMLHLPTLTWWRFLIWTSIGVIIYFLYGIRNSLLNTKTK